MAKRKTATKKGKSTAKRAKAVVRRAAGGAPGALTLPSGRSISFRAEEGTEQLEVRSAQGAMELRILLTKDGPVLSLSGVRLEIQSRDAVAVSCRSFEVRASEGVSLATNGSVAIAATGELRAKTGGQMHLDGELVNLNCGDRSGYPDEHAAAAAQAAIDAELAKRPAPQQAGNHQPCDHQH